MERGGKETPVPDVSSTKETAMAARKSLSSVRAAATVYCIYLPHPSPTLSSLPSRISLDWKHSPWVDGMGWMAGPPLRHALHSTRLASL
jgi:hypothetical protein